MKKSKLFMLRLMYDTYNEKEWKQGKNKVDKLGTLPVTSFIKLWKINFAQLHIAHHHKHYRHALLRLIIISHS